MRPNNYEASPSDQEVVELALLLPRWQATAVEEAANQQGITAGQMLRKMIASAIMGAAQHTR